MQNCRLFTAGALTAPLRARGKAPSVALLIGARSPRVLRHISTENPSTPRPENEPAPGKHGASSGRSRLGKYAIVSLIGTILGYAGAELARGHGKRETYDRFVAYTLAGKDTVSSNCSIFTIRPKGNVAIDLGDPSAQHAIKSVQLKQPQLQIARAYTILPPTEGQRSDELRLLIRKEHDGEVSGYLHRLSVGAEVEVRGPFVDFVIPERTTRAIFLAGGTGIAPAMQVAEMLTSNNASVHLLWANRRREDCVGCKSFGAGLRESPTGWLRWWKPNARADPPVVGISDNLQASNPIVTQLERLREATESLSRGDSSAPGLLSVDCFVDEENHTIDPAILRKMMATSTGQPGISVLFISGPEGFVRYWAGPKQWINGEEVQGPVGGVLGQQNTADWQIVKL